MEPITKAKMFEMLNQFAESLPDEGEAETGGEYALADEAPGGGKPGGEVEISVETKPEGMGMGKTCPTCGHMME
jgi:hypothetical protein